ncbi:MAG TPA: hypothetical protein VGP88_08830 [Thermoplasmata archaeon]|jgi:hypothetical protein|nr:hypothetical protein [Thermoplasmata archaeon]
MKVAGLLYGFFWLAVLQVVLGVLLAVGASSSNVVPYLHAALGGAVVVWAFVNFRAVRATRAPGRTKRTAAATFGIAVLMVVLGLLLWLGVEVGVAGLSGTVSDGIGAVHLVLALAIVAHAASTATGFDMWEEREFEQETEPGSVSAPPRV